jgi:hypothetical protein
MLSIRKCRDLLEEAQDLNDEEIGKLRDQLYELARAVVVAAGSEAGAMGSEMMRKSGEI